MSIYCFSDLHGRYELWEQIKNYIKPEDKVYCLGDCIDRGYGGYQILKEVLEHPQITMLLGNHEDFFLRCVPAFFNGKFSEFDLWCEWNGGLRTWTDVMDAPVGEVMDILKKLKKLPLHVELELGEKKIYLSHSGYNPWELEHELMRGVKEKDIYTWDRTHFHLDWFQAAQDYSDKFDFDNSYIIYGHTPVQHFTGWKEDFVANHECYDPRVYKRAEGHRIDIDLCSVESNRAVLFNLETFEEVYFECEEIKEEEF